MIQQINKSELVRRLESAIGETVGPEGLNILLYGWTRQDPRLRVNIRHRTWLYDYEVQAFSAYVGYNLLKTEA